MNRQFTAAEDFTSFKQFISDKLTKRDKRRAQFPDYKKAAVMMLFMEKDNSPHVILTLRTDIVSTHKGQVSFPGGGYDSTDKDLLDTALRETYEEVGIPSDEIEVLGEFDEYISIAGFHVHVYVGAVNRKQNYIISRDEIERMLEVPFSIFYEEQYFKCEKLVHEGMEFSVYYYDFDSATIWGMTARILTDFSRKIFKDKR